MVAYLFSTSNCNVSHRETSKYICWFFIDKYLFKTEIHSIINHFQTNAITNATTCRECDGCHVKDVIPLHIISQCDTLTTKRHRPTSRPLL